MDEDYDQEITIAGLTPLEFRELETALGPDAVKMNSPARPTGIHAEPVTWVLATLAISSPALTALTTVLVRNIKRSDRRIKLTRKTAKEEYSFELSESDLASSAPSEKVIAALAKGLSIDLEKVRSALNPDD